MTTVTVPGTFVGLDELDRSAFSPRDYSLLSVIGGGASSTLSDGDDATRVRLNAESTTGFNYAGVRISFPPVDIPANAKYPGEPTWEGVAFKFNLRGRRVAGTGTEPTYTSFVQLGYDGYWDPFGYVGNQTGFETAFKFAPASEITTTWQEWDTTNGGEVDYASNRPIMEEGFNNGRYPRAQSFRDGDSWLLMYWAYGLYYGDIEVSEVSLTLSWDGPTAGLPALRQVQRDDGRGLGGTPRAVQRSTQQSTIRTLTAPY